MTCDELTAEPPCVFCECQSFSSLVLVSYSSALALQSATSSASTLRLPSLHHLRSSSALRLSLLTAAAFASSSLSCRSASFYIMLSISTLISLCALMSLCASSFAFVLAVVLACASRRSSHIFCCWTFNSASARGSRLGSSLTREQREELVAFIPRIPIILLNTSSLLLQCCLSGCKVLGRMTIRR